MFGKTNSTLTERDVLDALKGVKDPDLGRDLVDLGMIKDIRITDGTVALAVNLTTPACPLKAQIERDVRTALQSASARRMELPDHHDGRSPRQGHQRDRRYPGHQERHRRRLGQGGGRQIDDGGRHRLRPEVLRHPRRADGRRRLRPVDPPPGRAPPGRPMARGERIQPIETDGLKLMSMGFLLEPERAVIMRGPMLHGIMQQFLRQVDWGQLGLPGDRLAAGHRRCAADAGPIAAPDRGRRGLHARRRSPCSTPPARSTCSDSSRFRCWG